jgi:hypothetical protein
MSLLYRDDVGAAIIIATNNTTLPVSTTLSVIVEKPSATVTTWDLTLPGDSVDFATGIITHTTVLGDLNESGEYKVQVHGVFADGDDTRSDIDTFTVHERLG